MILTSQKSEAPRSTYRLALLKIAHTRSHSLSNQCTLLTLSISALTLLTTCFNSMLKSLTLFLSCCFLCPLFPPLLFSPPPLHPSHYSPSLPLSLPLLCASACKVGIGKIPKHLRNPVALCLQRSQKKMASFCFALKVLS